MKYLIPFVLLLLTGNTTFSQKITSKDTDRNKTQDISVKDQGSKSGDKSEKNNQEASGIHISPGSSGVKRSIAYKFSDISEDADPGNGIFRYNNDTLSLVSYIFVDNNDLSGEDQTRWYGTWDDTTGATGRGRISIAQYEGNNVNVFDVSGVFLIGEGFWKIPVKYVSGALPVSGATYYYIFERIAHKKNDSDQVNKETEPVVPVPAEPAPVVPAPAEPAPAVQAPAEPTPIISEPAPVVPAPAEPAPVVQVPAEPAPVVQAPAEPAPVVQAPAEPAPVVTAQVELAPVIQVPAEPTPVAAEPVPVVQAPVEPAPVVAAPVEPAPVVQAPAEPTPVAAEPVPVVQAQVEPAPVVAAPVEPAPVVTAPVELVPVVTTPAEPAPVVQVPAEPAPVVTIAAEPVPVVQVPAEPAPVITTAVETKPVEAKPIERPKPVERPRPVERPKPVEKSEPVTATKPPEQPETLTEPRPLRQAKPAEQTKPVEQPKPVVQPKPAEQTKPVEQPKPIQQPGTVEQPKPVQQTNPVGQPKPVQQPKPVEQSKPPEKAKPVTQVSQYEANQNQVSVYQNNYGASRVKHGKCYRGIIEAGYGWGIGDYGINNLRLNFINGFHIGPNFSLGLGIGVRRYFMENEYHTGRSIVSGKVQVPVFLDLRTTLSSKKVTPYFALGIGNSARYTGQNSEVSDSTKSVNEGLFFNPSAGIWINISSRFAVFTGIAYEMQKMEFLNVSDNTPYKKNTSSISINIGISF